MAEERSFNGEATGQDDGSLYDSYQQDKSTKLNRKIGDFDSQNQELARDNDEINREIESLTAEIEELKGAECAKRGARWLRKRRLLNSPEIHKHLMKVKKLGEDVVVKKKKKLKEQRIDSEAENDGKKKKKNKVKLADSVAQREDDVKKESKKTIKEIKVDNEADVDDNVIGNSESSKVCENPIVETDDANKKKGTRKRDDCDLGAQEHTDKEMKRKSKKKESVDSEVEESNEDSDSMKDAVKEKKKKKKKNEEKHTVDSEVEENNSDGKDAKRKKEEATVW